MKDRLPYVATEHDFGVLTALGDPRVASAARFFGLPAIGQDLEPEKVDVQQKRLAGVMADHQISADELNVLIDWHAAQEASWSPLKPEAVDFLQLMHELSREEAALGENDGDYPDISRAEQMLALWTLKCQLRYHKLRYGNKT